jgi:hypothetical protein
MLVVFRLMFSLLELSLLMLAIPGGVICLLVFRLRMLLALLVLLVLARMVGLLIFGNNPKGPIFQVWPFSIYHIRRNVHGSSLIFGGYAYTYH